jgi:hypothetical protein
VQTPTTQRKPKARTLTADSKLPYPKYRYFSEVPLLDCWLIHWFRDQGQSELLFKTAKHRAFRSRASDCLGDAYWLAICNARHQAETSIKSLRDRGGLLFAWAGTTHPAVQS